MLEQLREKSHTICCGLIITGALLWLFSLFQARDALRNNANALGQLGLFSILPFLFFAALSLLVLSFFFTLLLVRKNRLSLLICHTFLLILVLNLTPAIVEGTARFSTSYFNYQTVDYVSKIGHVDSSVFWALNWPGFSIFISIFTQITGISGQSILLVYPTIYNSMLFVPLFLLFRALSKDDRVVWLALWFAFFGNWVGQDYFSMQSIGFLVIVLVLFLLLKNMNQGMHKRQWGIMFFLLFSYTVSSHFLSSLAILSVTLVLFLAKYLRRPFLLFSSATLVAAWTIFNANNYLNSNLVANLRGFLNVFQIFQRNVTTRITTGAVSHVLVTQIRVAYSGIILAVGFLGIILLWRNKNIGTAEKRLLAVLVGFSLLVVTFAYGGELFMRIYWFALIPLAYFASKAILKHKSVLFLGILFFVIAAPSMFVVAYYGNESKDYTPYSETLGVVFLFNETTHGDIVGAYKDLYYHPTYSHSTLYSTFMSNASGSLWTKPNAFSKDRFLCITSYETAVFNLFIGDNEFIQDVSNNVTQSPFYDRIYSNPTFDIYYSDGAQ